MGRRKKSNGIQNDRCLICHFCAWEEKQDKYLCSTEGCHNNNKFKMYRPSWMEREENGSKNN